MNFMPSLSRMAAAAIIVAVVSGPLNAAEDHIVVRPDQVEWKAGPGSIPPGAEASVLYGDPSKAELFVLRLKLPAGYHIAPHIHPKPEIVTVISGEVKLGMGETANPDATEALGPGSLFAMHPGMVHYIYTDKETVLQLNSSGPWNLTYVNPEDDPRKQN